MARPVVLDRLSPTSVPLMRRLALATLAGQAGITLTGAVVRVTGSGLGCPTWPQCQPGSMVPVPRAEIAALHQWVEFGNRLLTFVLVVVAGLTLLAALNTRPRRPRLTRLALAQPLGVLAQAVIGGVTVLTGLAWWTVIAHLLVSLVLVWLAVLLVDAAGQAEGPPRPAVPAPLRRLVAFSSAVLAALLLAGSLVTSAGPHAGDPATPRLGIEVADLAQLHTDLLFGYLGLLAGLGFALRAVAAPAALWRRYHLLAVAVALQGVLGAVQYALGVPATLVPLHVLGAALVTIGAAALWSGTSVREPAGPATAEAGRDPVGVAGG